MVLYDLFSLLCVSVKEFCIVVIVEVDGKKVVLLVAIVTGKQIGRAHV